VGQDVRMNRPPRIVRWLRQWEAPRPLDLRKAASHPPQPPGPVGPPGRLVPGMREPLGREFLWRQSLSAAAGDCPFALLIDLNPQPGLGQRQQNVL
jgi:hypothetical protein